MFRFTIRDLLWLTVVVALGVGWWMDRRGLAKFNAELQTAVEAQTAAKEWSLAAAKEQRDRAASLQRQLEKLQLGTVSPDPSSAGENLPGREKEARLRRFIEGARIVDETLPTADEVINQLRSSQKVRPSPSAPAENLSSD